MGTTYYTLAVFDKPWEEVLDKALSRVQIQLHYELKTTEQSTVDWFEVETYSKENMMLLYTGVSTSRWLFVLSSELMKFLRMLMRAGTVLICGYTDDNDLRKAGFEENNSYSSTSGLVETIKRESSKSFPLALLLWRKNS